LPNYKRVFGFGGFVRIPKLGSRVNTLFMEFPNNKKLEKEHFWELGSSKETKVKKVKQIVKKHYTDATVNRYSLNPYHYSFICSC